jgi:hypothetical protein
LKPYLESPGLRRIAGLDDLEDPVARKPEISKATADEESYRHMGRQVDLFDVIARAGLEARTAGRPVNIGQLLKTPHPKSCGYPFKIESIGHNEESINVVWAVPRLHDNRSRV